MSYRILFESVVQSKLCCFCGACVSVCPHDCLAFHEKGPQLVSPCKECGKCIEACPGFGAPLSEITKFLFQRELTEAEEKRGLGIIIEDRDLISADPEILESGYTGGKVTALLSYLFERDEIDGAVVASYGTSTPYPHFCWPKIAEDKAMLLECSGSKYTFSPNLMSLKELANNGRLRSIAFLGLGCHLIGLRKIQLLGESYKPLIDKISYVFGLFCSGPMVSSGDFMRFVAKICETRVEDIDTVDFHRVIEDAKFNIEFTIALKNGKKKSRKVWINDFFFMLKLLDQWPRCSMCMDYSAEFADISFGGGHILSRTPKGEQLMQRAIADGILISSNDPFWQEFTQSAKETDVKIVRAKKLFNAKRIKKNLKKQGPVPDFGINFSET